MGYLITQHNLSICQNIILKIIFINDCRCSTLIHYKHLKILNIRSLYVHLCLNYLFKIKHIFLTVLHSYDNRLKIGSINNSLFTTTHNQRHITKFDPECFTVLPLKIKLKVNKSEKFKNKARNYNLNFINCLLYALPKQTQKNQKILKDNSRSKTTKSGASQCGIAFNRHLCPCIMRYMALSTDKHDLSSTQRRSTGSVAQR